MQFIYVEYVAGILRKMATNMSKHFRYNDLI